MNDDSKSRREFRIPTPPHPLQRHEKLPWQTPKSAVDDADAARRVQRIMAAPAYRQTDQDLEFLSQDATRGIRLQLDYSKPEVLLEQHGIRHTIVAFGGTRIPEPAMARRQVQTLERTLDSQPKDREVRRKLGVARRLLDKSRFYQAARDFGRLVGDSGNGPADSRVVLMTGGGPGMMEAANRGAWEAGASSRMGEQVPCNFAAPLAF